MDEDRSEVLKGLPRNHLWRCGWDHGRICQQYWAPGLRIRSATAIGATPWQYALLGAALVVLTVRFFHGNMRALQADSAQKRTPPRAITLLELATHGAGSNPGQHLKAIGEPQSGDLWACLFLFISDLILSALGSPVLCNKILASLFPSYKVVWVELSAFSVILLILFIFSMVDSM